MRASIVKGLIEESRRKFRPRDSIKVLFVAEAPPADPKRFFYFEHVSTHDALYLETMRALYEEATDVPAAELRRRKPEFLSRFQADGKFLIDARQSPMPREASAAMKHRLLIDALPSLLETVKGLVSPETEVVLISSPVYVVCGEPLRAAGINVVNREAIDFPASGHQPVFRRKLARDLDAHLRSVIRGLEAAVRFFGAGEEQQKARDLYVIEHFIRGLGVTFDPKEILQDSPDPPDATFRGAAFEVKEVYEDGRRRGDEYREQLAKAQAAWSSAELLEHFTPENISIAEVYERIMAATRLLASDKYRVEAVRRSLDLVFYVNLGMKAAWGIDEGPHPSIESLIAEGWRSVSFLHGISTSCVIVAGPTAPAFLQAAQGKAVFETL